jgi:hypothetical protein
MFHRLPPSRWKNVLESSLKKLEIVRPKHYKFQTRDFIVDVWAALAQLVEQRFCKP